MGKDEKNIYDNLVIGPKSWIAEKLVAGAIGGITLSPEAQTMIWNSFPANPPLDPTLLLFLYEQMELICRNSNAASEKEALVSFIEQCVDKKTVFVYPDPGNREVMIKTAYWDHLNPSATGEEITFIIGGVANDPECVLSLTYEANKLGQRTFTLPHHNAYGAIMDKNTANWFKKSQMFDKNAQYFSALIKQIIMINGLEKERIRVVGFSTGVPIAIRLMEDYWLSEKMSRVLFLAPTATTERVLHPKTWKKMLSEMMAARAIYNFIPGLPQTSGYAEEVDPRVKAAKSSTTFGDLIKNVHYDKVYERLKMILEENSQIKVEMMAAKYDNITISGRDKFQSVMNQIADECDNFCNYLLQEMNHSGFVKKAEAILNYIDW